MRRGTFQWMKSVNKSVVLNKIRKNAPISRAQIAKETELTPPTVSSIVKELLDQGIIRESVLGQSSGGRKPTMLLINNKAFSIVGVDAGPETIDCVLSDLSGNIIERYSQKLPIPIESSEFLSILKESIYRIIESSGVSQEEIMGIGVAMHGVVDVEKGISLFAPNLALTNIPIKETLEKHFELEVKVENDARAMALGEAWFGNHGDTDSMLAVNIGRGVGAGVVINGKLYHGSQDIAGEVGHMTIDINGKVCQCGNRGCLQTFVTGDAIARRAQEIIQDSGEPLAHASLTGEKVFRFATNGEKLFVKVLEETGEIIGIGLTNLIHIINPGKIILGGGVTNSKKFLMPSIRETIVSSALTQDAKKTEITVTELGEDATLIGAVSLLLVELFDAV